MQKRYERNINKIKLENFKEIYFLVEKNILDLKKITEFGISESIIEKIIIPVVSILDKRKIELNFENFFSLAKEFFKKMH